MCVIAIPNDVWKYHMQIPDCLDVMLWRWATGDPFFRVLGRMRWKWGHSDRSRSTRVCPESNSPFWISREAVMWPWCNLATSQRKPYCTSVNNHSTMGLVSRQWDAVDWACVPCDCRIHRSPLFPIKKIPSERFTMGRRIDANLLIFSLGHCECYGHTEHNLSQRRLTADWLAPRESGCSRMCSMNGCQVTLRPHDRFSRCSKWLDNSQIGLLGKFSSDDTAS